MNKFLALFIVVVAGIAGAEAQCPNIITRTQWGAREATTGILPIQPAPFVVMHHTDGPNCINIVACAQQMRDIQNFHMDVNGWADIGYNFLIGEDGNVYEGRGWGRQGAHALGYNNQSLGMGIIGTFTTRLPSIVSRNTARLLILCGVSLGHLSESYWLIAHRQASDTECPGDVFFNDLTTWARFNANPTPI